MKKALDAVEAFHEAFNLGKNPEPIAHLGPAKNELRFHLMEEENQEYLVAAQTGDLHAVADALGDMLYILLGTIVEHGMQHTIEDIFFEIHRSNMSKLDTHGRPIYREDGKVLKGTDYSRPNFSHIL